MKGGSGMYKVTIIDYYGRAIPVPVSREVYEVYEEDRRREERERFERRKHIDRRGLEDYIQAHELEFLSQTMEEVHETLEVLRVALAVARTCTPLQQRRFYLHCFGGCAYADIAALQRCSEMTVRESVRTVKKKVKTFFDKHPRI